MDVKKMPKEVADDAAEFMVDNVVRDTRRVREVIERHQEALHALAGHVLVEEDGKPALAFDTIGQQFALVALDLAEGGPGLFAEDVPGVSAEGNVVLHALAYAYACLELGHAYVQDLAQLASDVLFASEVNEGRPEEERENLLGIVQDVEAFRRELDEGKA